MWFAVCGATADLNTETASQFGCHGGLVCCYSNVQAVKENVWIFFSYRLV